MPNFKFTWLFDWQSRAGWSETFYRQFAGNTAGEQPSDLAVTWARERARCMSANCTIISCRISDMANPRVVRAVSIGAKGALGAGIIRDNIQPDVVNIAQLVTFNTENGPPRYYLQRGLDDRDVNDGIIDFGQNGRGAFTRFYNFVVNNNWAMKDMIKVDTLTVDTVDGATKKVFVKANNVIAAGDTVLLESRTVGQGLKVRWQGKVKGVDGLGVILQGYRYGDAEGGTISKLNIAYRDIRNFQLPSPNWARTRQTGRPFNLPRGRAPKRT